MRKLKTIEQAIGGLTITTKIPGRSFSLSAWKCKTGSKLAKVPGTVCFDCYARKGAYRYPCVKAAMVRRHEALKAIRVWTENMVELLTRGRWDNWQYFRWHDSGDIQSARHLAAIVEIAERVPGVSFWLPTKEYRLVFNVVLNLPRNLIIRVSSPRVGMYYPGMIGLVSSSVDSGQGFSCPAPTQNGTCGDCRACWNKGVSNVDYHKH